MHRLAPIVRQLFPEHVAACVIDFNEQRPPLGVPLPPTVASSVPKRRAEFVAGRLCARAALAAAGCASNDEIAIGPMRAPVWPKGFVGSISHASGVAAAVATRASQAASLGLDLEKVVTAELASSLAATVARDEELTLVARMTPGGATTTFTTVFAAKEALFKCAAPLVGRYFEFLDAEVTSAASDRLVLRLGVDLSEGFHAGRLIEVRLAFAPPFVIAGAIVAPTPEAVSAPRTPAP